MPYLNPIISLSHSGHQSLFSEPREKTLSDQSNRRQKTLTAGKIFRRTFPANFPATVFFYTARSAWRRSSICPKAPEPETHPRAAHARFSVRRLHLTRRRVRAREPLSDDALPPPGSPDADQPPFLPVCAIQALHVPLLGFFCFRGPSDQIFRRPSAIFSQLQSLHVPWEVFFYLPVHDKIRNGIITRHKLNGHNYLQWSQSVLLFICGKGKDEYLTGEAVMPETTEPGFRKWKIENSMIMSWLINSMNNDIGENFLAVESALHDFRQGEQSVTQYYNTLTRYWQQLDLFETHSWKCSDDAATYRQIVEQKRLFKFFLGLNRELDDVRGRIMGIKPLPSLREAFSEVRREESRKKVMMGSKEQPAPTLDASALAARSFNSSGGDRQKRDRPWCDYCKKPGHYKETCWKLHGKPADWKPKPRVDRDGRAHVAANSESTSVPEPSPFNKEQMEMLQKLLSQVGSGSTTGVAFTANRGGMRPWIVDTGASDHMTGDAAILQNYKSSNGHSSVHIADGSKSKIAGTGSIKLTKDLYLDSVLHVPNLDCNLLSISKLARDLQCVTKFYPNLCVFQDLKSGKMIGSAELCSGLYLLSCGQFSNQVSQASCVQSQSMSESFNSVSNSKVNKDSEIIMLHYRLGHPSFVYLAKLFPKLFINKNPASYHCEICQFAKHTRTVYPQIPYKPSTVFSLVHSDVWGPSRIKNISGTRWFVTFVDDHTRVTWVFLMKEKSEVGHIFQTFNLMVQNQFNSKIQVLKSDNAKEYFTSSLSTYLQNHGIIHISSCVDTPQQNGVAERKNRHLLEVARCLMFSSNVPNYFWGEAILTATYLINRMPSRVLTFQSPRQLFLNSFLTPMPPLLIYHSKYLVAQHSFMCILKIGESMNEHQVWESFLEGVPSFHSESPNPSQFAPTELSTPMPPSVQPPQHTNVSFSRDHPVSHAYSTYSTQLANENLQVYIRRRKRQELEHGSQSTCGQYIDSNSSLPEENIGEDRDGEVPNTIQEALKISEWKKAVQDEIDALEKNGTWTITDLPVGKRPVGCKWIFTIKYKADGLVERFKARLVARGFTQSYGIDYQETFAPVAKLNTIRILLSLAVNQDWCLQQLDIKNAFLNGDLEEEVYMEIPPGFEESMAKNQVCKLQKSLYGLKQSPRAWFDRFTKAVLKLGYKQGQADHTLFVKKSHAGKLAILIVYVDDIILSGNDMGELQKLKKYLSEEFEVKDLGNLKYFLGMEVARSRKGIVVSQRNTYSIFLRRPVCLDANQLILLWIVRRNLVSRKKVHCRQGRYQRLVGRLIYLSHTRPDIGFAVSAVSQFMHSPTEEHMEAVYRILRYLKMTPGKGLFFRKTENRDTEVYSDADWAGNIIDRRSTSGYCSFVWGNLVTWRSKKQSVVARSSAEAEYRALAQGICEGIWIKRVLSELGQTSSSPILMMCDNQAAIRIAKNPVHHDRTKHVEIDRHFITEKVTSETVKLNYVPTKHQTADILTKALPRPNFEDLTCKLGLYDIYSPA
ncbi:Retrovirus-related Pol polyprotein from transposon TNT 1-94 [Vitis vinifera]|uniref:Retrovirus-related Pol polyprotein from transposon TNT 1-94 n=1 Tax=Vitis vinifera TaxID=29760 RepID=A0A438K038_VITVI|nr:Retrovirus-related Pol polyprotein from transposon TNT 1-94 [Vitis vinifera]